MIALNRVSLTSVGLGAGLVLAGCASPIDETGDVELDEATAALEEQMGDGTADDEQRIADPELVPMGTAPGLEESQSPQQLSAIEEEESASASAAAPTDETAEEGSVAAKSEELIVGPGPVPFGYGYTYYGPGGYGYSQVPGVVVGPGYLPPMGYGYSTYRGSAWGRSCGPYGCVYW
jgi:hypothetical protein